MMAGDATGQFADAITAAGLTRPEHIEADGELHRFASNGKRGDDAGYYVLHLDGVPAGHFGCWRAGVAQSWRADLGRKLSPAEAIAHQERVEKMQREREAEQARRQAEAREKAAAVWRAASPVAQDHPYLRRKRVAPVPTLRELLALEVAAVLGYAPRSREHELVGRLIVVPIKVGTALSTLEFIDENGLKTALAGGAKAGGYWSPQALPAGDGGGMTLLIGEGVATVLSAREATGQPAVAALSCGNLSSVARTMRDHYPSAKIVILADLGNGEEKAREAALAIGGLLALPGFCADRPEGASDFNDMMLIHGAEAVKRAVESAVPPDTREPVPSAPDAPGADPAGAWPDPMDRAAFHGIAGELVRMIEPDTEADPAAILVQFLAAFGALVGRGPHYRVESDEHHANLFVALVGPTSAGRKGTSWGRVRDALARVPDWKPEVKGLASGEGIKYHVRDPREERKTSRQGEPIVEIADPGVDDKRLLVVEPEFAGALRAAQRQGSTLSATIREAWDTGNLRTLTKNDPITATGAHISIIGQITTDELRAELTATDAANGFANRFLFVATRRSKLLPFGGEAADEGEIVALAGRLHERALTARTKSRMGMTAQARAVWTKVYERLTEGAGGLHGAATARAAPQVLRIALIYALLDGADRIDAPHLMAALAVWQYCDATAKYIFGASLGDRIADEIERRLDRAGEGGLTRTELRDAFGRHQSVERIGAALDLLRTRGRATCEVVKTQGRPVETWRAAR